MIKHFGDILSSDFESLTHICDENIVCSLT